MIFFSSAEVYSDYEGIMTEDVMINNPIKDTYRMNDYAITNLFLCGVPPHDPASPVRA